MIRSRAKNLVHRFVGNDDGAALVFVIISLPLILLLLVLVIDLDAGRLTKNRLQIAADASALAGASVLPTTATVQSEAVDYAAKNYPNALAGSPVLTNADIQIGNWDRVNRTFTIGGTPTNAVQTTTRRDATNNNPLQSIFGLIAGQTDYDISASAVAVSGAGTEFPCIGGGILTLDEYNGQSTNDYNSFCVYSDIRVSIQSDNNINAGTVFAMPDERDYEQQGNNTYADFENQIVSDQWTLPLLDMISDVIDDAQDGDLPDDLPFAVENTVTINDSIDVTTPLAENTLYIVDGDVKLKQGNHHQYVAIVATGVIELESNGTMSNMVLLAEKEVKTGSYVTVGTPGACTDNGGDFGVYMFSEDKVLIASNTNLYGVQAASLSEFNLGSNTTALGLYVESVGKAEVASNQSLGACEDGLGSAFGTTDASISGDLKLVLVD